MLQALSIPPLPGAPRLVTGAVLPAAKARRVVVQSTLLTVRATMAPGDPSLESPFALPPVPVGTTGRTVTAGTLLKAPPQLPAAPARTSTELKRADDAPALSPVSAAEAAIATARTAPVADPPSPWLSRDRSVPANAADEVSKQTEIVLGVLREYSRAYDRLDVRATKAVYPSIDDRKLQRAFQELEGQQVRFASCGVSISSSGAGANARCRGDATFRPKVGSRIVRLTDREWTFSLSRDGSNWQILDARMQ